MGSGGGGPQAETVVMLGGDDGHLESSLLQALYPLFRIETGGIEQGGGFFPVAPFAIGKGVDAEMQKGREFQLLPLVLLRSGHKPGSHFHFLFHWGILRKLHLLHVIMFFFLGCRLQQAQVQAGKE